MTESSIKSKRILNLVVQTEYDEIEVAALQPLVEDFEKTLGDLKSLPDDPKNVKTKLHGEAYLSAAEDFLKSSKEMMRRIRDKKSFTESEIRMGEMTEGTPQNVVSKYNYMIRRQNSLQ